MWRNMNTYLINRDTIQVRLNILVNGFTNGFDLKYNGERRVRRMAPNLPFRVGNPTDLWNKVMVEVKNKR